MITTITRQINSNLHDILTEMHMEWKVLWNEKIFHMFIFRIRSLTEHCSS